MDYDVPKNGIEVIYPKWIFELGYEEFAHFVENHKVKNMNPKDIWKAFGNIKKPLPQETGTDE